MFDERLIQITKHGLCAGLVLQHGRCIAAAPTLKRSIGQTEAALRQYFRNNGYNWTNVPTTAATQGRPLHPRPNNNCDRQPEQTENAQARPAKANHQL